MAVDSNRVKTYMVDLQARIVAALEAFDGKPFREDAWDRPGGGGGATRVIEEGDFFERGGCNFSHVFGEGLPPSATAARPELAGRGFEAMGEATGHRAETGPTPEEMAETAAGRREERASRAPRSAPPPTPDR